MLAINGIIELPHLIVRYLSFQLVNGFFYLRMLRQRLLANDRHRVIRREIMAIVFQYK